MILAFYARPLLKECSKRHVYRVIIIIDEFHHYFLEKGDNVYDLIPNNPPFSGQFEQKTEIRIDRYP